MDNNREIGRNMRNLREKQGLTQEKLGKKAGVSRKHINRIEAGDIKHIEKYLLEQIAIALDVPVETIRASEEKSYSAIRESRAVYTVCEEKSDYILSEQGKFKKKLNTLKSGKVNFIKSQLPEKLYTLYPDFQIDFQLMNRDKSFDLVLYNAQRKIIFIYETSINKQIVNRFMEDLLILKKDNENMEIEGVIVVINDDKSVDAIKPYVEMIPSITVKKVKFEYQISLDDICVK